MSATDTNTAKLEQAVVRKAMALYHRQPRDWATWFANPLSLRVLLDDIDRACDALQKARTKAGKR